MEREAKRLYESWFNEQALEPWQNVEAEIYEAVLAKLHGQCLRIALILHCLEMVDTHKPDISPVSPETMEKAIILANCFKAHQRNTWQSIINQDKVAELTPLQKQVARAILSLEGEIVGGMLATARITEQVNQNLDPKFHVSVHAVGKTAAPLGFTPRQLPDGAARGFQIMDEGLQKLKSLFQASVGNVGNVGRPELVRAPGDMSIVSKASEMSEHSSKTDGGRHFRHVADVCESAQEAEDSSLSDISDDSGISPGRNNLRELDI